MKYLLVRCWFNGHRLRIGLKPPDFLGLRNKGLKCYTFLFTHQSKMADPRLATALSQA